jgi:hypothetical protein
MVALPKQRRSHCVRDTNQVINELATPGACVEAAGSVTPFGPVDEEWFAAKKPVIRPSTAVAYRSLLDMTVLPRWRDVRLVDITHADVQKWVTWLTTSPDARQPRTTDRKKGRRSPLSAKRAVDAPSNRQADPGSRHRHTVAALVEPGGPLGTQFLDANWVPKLANSIP